MTDRTGSDGEAVPDDDTSGGDRSSMSWDSTRYDDEHSFVYEYGADVVDLLAPAAGDRVLDLGCGTGHLTNRIAEAGARVVGLDASPEMVRRARERYPDLSFVRGDARCVAFTESFDAVFSNAAIHWIPTSDQPRVGRSVGEALRPGGRFVAEFGGAGNVVTITDAIAAELTVRGRDPPDPWYFPTIAEHATLLERLGFEVTYATLFDRPTPLDGGADGLQNWLTTFGDPFLAPLSGRERREIVEAVEERLEPRLFDGNRWTIDYRRLRFVARYP